MVAIAMGLLWAGYTAGLWGYCLIKGYDISFVQLVSPVNWYSGSWPPPGITDPSVILPGGQAAAKAKPPGTAPNKPPDVGNQFPKIPPPGG